MVSNSLKLFRVLLAAGCALVAQAAWSADPKIAVTDLSYETKVKKQNTKIEYSEKHRQSASSKESDESASDRSSSRSELSYNASSNTEIEIERGELRKFTADIKGQLLKSGYRLVQGKPWTAKETETMFDIIERIKQGYYPGADYVLFGVVNHAELRRDDNPIQGSNATSHTLSVELVAEFSLIDTKTYEVKAGFSAMGEGSDTKMTNSPNARHILNRSKAMQEVSRSLGEAVAKELSDQFGGKSAARSERKTETVVEKTITYTSSEKKE